MATQSIWRLIGRELRWAVLALVVTMAVATAGYVVIADYPWFDALYMTVITLGTIGFSEVHPLGTAGRWWTIGVTFTGFATLVYAGGALTNLLLSGRLTDVATARKNARMRDGLVDHIIVVGYGRVGRVAVETLRQQGIGVAVIDPDPRTQDEIAALGAVRLSGDGRDEDMLRFAGIDRARGLVAATPDDADNLVVVLTGRALRDALRIIARVNEPEWEPRMKRAGADHTLLAYQDVGAGLADAVINPGVLGRHDLHGLGLRTVEICLPEGSSLAGRPLSEVSHLAQGVLLLGVHRANEMKPWDEVHEELAVGDVVVALGAPAALARVEAAAGQRSPRFRS